MPNIETCEKAIEAVKHYAHVVLSEKGRTMTGTSFVERIGEFIDNDVYAYIENRVKYVSIPSSDSEAVIIAYKDDPELGVFSPIDYGKVSVEEDEGKADKGKKSCPKNKTKS